MANQTIYKGRALTPAEKMQRHRANVATKMALLENISNEAIRVHHYVHRESKRGNELCRPLCGDTPQATLKKIKAHLEAISRTNKQIPPPGASKKKAL